MNTPASKSAAAPAAPKPTPAGSTPIAQHQWDYLGFNYPSWYDGKFADAESTQALGQMKATGAESATIVSTHFLDNLQSSKIFNTNKTESLQNIEKAIIDSKNQGLSVWLKPHIDTVNFEWRGQLNPTDRIAFFSNYKALIMDYAELAQSQGVEVLVIGTEIDQLIGEADKAAWLDIIKSVRQVYNGKLTYAANWDKADKVSFAEGLDFVGIDAYYPLTENKEATVDELVQAWTSPPQTDAVKGMTNGLSLVEWLKQVSEGYGKPLAFTELGFRSLDGTAAKPYEFNGGGKVDLEEQARLYEAVFKVFGGGVPEAGNVDWFKGAQFWNWYATEAQNSDPTDLDYPILGKPAEQVFKTYSAQLTSGVPKPDLVDPTPVDPTPVDPTPINPTPVDPTPVDPTPVDPTPVDPMPIDAIRINVGGDAFTDSSGKVWSADQYFQNGNIYTTTADIGQTTDDTLSQSERFQQNLSYEIPVENGDYTVNLNFAEIYFDAAGQRVFDVSAEGALQLDNYDIYTAAGGQNQQVQESLTVKVTDGSLTLDLNASVNNAKLSSIEVLKATPETPTTPTTPTTPKTTTPTPPFVGGGQIVEYQFGQDVDITDFNPATDKLDLKETTVHSLVMVETKEGYVGLREVSSGKTNTLIGVAMKDLTVDNFVPIKISDHLREDVSSALAWSRGEAVIKPNTVYVRSHQTGVHETVDFNPATDKISFMYYGGRERLSATDTAEGVKFASAVTGQSLTLKGVKLSQIEGSHFEFHHAQLKEDNLMAKMGLDFSVPDINIFGRKNIPVAGGYDRQYELPDYQAGNPVMASNQQGGHDHSSHLMSAAFTTAASDLAADETSGIVDTLLAPQASLEGSLQPYAGVSNNDSAIETGLLSETMPVNGTANNSFALSHGVGEFANNDSDFMPANNLNELEMIHAIANDSHAISSMAF